MPTIQDYRDALDALIPLAESRAEDLSDLKEAGDEDPEFPGADAAWEAVETARALMAIPQTPDASALMLAALKRAETRLYVLECNGADVPADDMAAIKAAIAAEGRDGDTPDATDAPNVEPVPVDFEQRRDGWLIAFIPISSAARQWLIETEPKGARWEHARWYAKRDRAPAVRHAIEAEGFTVREG